MTMISSQALLTRSYASSRGSGGILFWGSRRTLSCCRHARQQQMPPSPQQQPQQRHVRPLSGLSSIPDRKPKEPAKWQVEMAKKRAWKDRRDMPSFRHGHLARKRGRRLEDRVAFAKHISGMLGREELDNALAAVHNNWNQGFDTIVGWNLIFEYLFKKEGAERGFKEYNDMKKRGRQPGNHTCTVMLKGCAMDKSEKALEIGLKIYKSIFEPNSEVEPSIIHHNAALDLCARHYDMETLWKVAAAIPESGPNGPGRATFSIIINAIKATAVRDVGKLEPATPSTRHTSEKEEDDVEGLESSGSAQAAQDPSLERKAAAVKQGKKVWADVTHHWRTGAFAPDSRLVFAMGDLLLFGGRERDYRDVFSLLRQTLALPLAGDINKRPQSGRQEDDSDSLFKWNKDGVSVREAESVATEGKSDPESSDEEFPNLFDAVNFKDVRKTMKERHGEAMARIEPFPTPTNLELCLALVAGNNLPNGVRIARKYWDLLTSTRGKYKVTPDHGSSHEYLRVLRKSRASGETLQFIQREMSPCKMTLPKTFVIGMSACSRDKNNLNVVETAGVLVEIMRKDLRMPDPAVLDRYMDIVRMWIGKKAVPEFLEERAQYEIRLKRLAKALDRLKPPMQTLEEGIAPGAKEIRKMPRRQHLLPAPGFTTKDAISALQNYQKLLQTILEPPLVSKIDTVCGVSGRERFLEEKVRVRKFLGEHHGRSMSKRNAEPEDE